jgi:hypothetical protein
MEIFLFIAVFAIVVGAGIGWLFRGRVLLIIVLCAITACLGQASVIICAGPPIEHFTIHYLIGYTTYMVGPFLLFYLLPCTAAGITITLVTRRLCK